VGRVHWTRARHDGWITVLSLPGLMSLHPPGSSVLFSVPGTVVLLHQGGSMLGNDGWITVLSLPGLMSLHPPGSSVLFSVPGTVALLHQGGSMLVNDGWITSAVLRPLPATIVSHAAQLYVAVWLVLLLTRWSHQRC